MVNGHNACKNRIVDAKNFVPAEKGVFYFGMDSFITEDNNSTNENNSSSTLKYHQIFVIEDDGGSQSVFVTDGIQLPSDLFRSVDEFEGIRAVDDTGYVLTVGEILERKFQINSSCWTSEVRILS